MNGNWRNTTPNRTANHSPTSDSKSNTVTQTTTSDSATVSAINPVTPIIAATANHQVATTTVTATNPVTLSTTKKKSKWRKKLATMSSTKAPTKQPTAGVKLASKLIKSATNGIAQKSSENEKAQQVQENKTSKKETKTTILTIESNVSSLFISSNIIHANSTTKQTIPTTIVPMSIETNSTLQEEEKIISLLNQTDKLQVNNEISDIEKRFNILQADMAMDKLKQHWKSKYGGTIQYDSVLTKNKSIKAIKNNKKSNIKQKHNRKNTQSKYEKKVLNNNKNNKIVDILNSMEVDYDWNGQYYCESNENQSIVVKPNSESFCDDSQLSINNGFSLFYFILLISYFLYFQIINALETTDNVLTKVENIEEKILHFDEIVHQMQDSLYNAAKQYDCIVNHKNYLNVFDKDYFINEQHAWNKNFDKQYQYVQKEIDINQDYNTKNENFLTLNKHDNLHNEKHLIKKDQYFFKHQEYLPNSIGINQGCGINEKCIKKDYFDKKHEYFDKDIDNYQVCDIAIDNQNDVALKFTSTGVT